MPFLPVVKGDKPFDFVLISVDAYVDHPSFGHAIVSRLIQALGFTIGIIPQPQTESDYKKLGKPNIAFLLSGGVVDSMVNNYTVAKQKRKVDSYSDEGKVGRIPDRALQFHSKNIKKYYSDSYLICGGVEATLRRFAHYDYWKDIVMPSILVDCPIDLMIYGMGEGPIIEIAQRLNNGESIEHIRNVDGTCYLSDYNDLSDKIKTEISMNAYTFLPSYKEVCDNKLSYVKAYNIQFNNSEWTGKPLIQKNGNKYVICNKPYKPLDIATMDFIYELPYMRNFHPMYKHIPAIDEVKFSITAQRGCFGGCSYCSIAFLQGRLISKRSKESIVKEAEKLTKFEDFKGYIHDLSAPTANFRIASCEKQEKVGSCTKKYCIGYEKCDNLKVDHTEWIDILRAVRSVKGVKKVFIRSGIRYDYLSYDKNFRKILEELIEHHISGQLKVAPEHCSDRVLRVMNKPPFSIYKKFKDAYSEINIKKGLKQFLVPYLISSHPESKIEDAISLAQYLKSINYMPLQVQDFYPTPSTRSTTMYYTGIDPFTLKEVSVPRTNDEKLTQRAFLQYRLPQNYNIIRDALILAKRKDLIGNSKNCIIR